MADYRNCTDPDSVGRLLILFDTLSAVPARLSAGDIHHIRVAIKRTRAWLKLCRAVSGDTPAYQQLVGELRQLGHALSAQRDRDVALQTLAKLAGKYPGKKAEYLIQELSREIAQQGASEPDTQALTSHIARIRQELPDFTCLALPRPTQIKVIQRAFSKMCKLGDRALRAETCAELHGWRKQVKSLLYQLEVVADSLPRQDRVQRNLGKLGNRLGEVHDLCVIQAIIEDKVAMAQPPFEATPVFRRIDRERSRLIASCRKHHRRLCTSGH